MIKKISNSDFSLNENDFNFEYQNILSTKLDKHDSYYTQNIINEIVLWKVNRYVQIDEELLELLNTINKNEMNLDIDKTRKILFLLLKTKGVQIAMASTILRFKNPNIYQIIDQRVYRIIYGKSLGRLNLNKSDSNINKQINLYFKYLKDLKFVCEKLKIDFQIADRILYNADKRLNRNVKLNNY